MPLELTPLLDLTPLDEEESDQGYERPPRGEMLEPEIPRPSIGATGTWGSGATGTWEEESPEQRRIRAAVDLFAARKEGDAVQREVESLGEQYRSIERFTPAGILNQPERFARALAAPNAPEIPERFQPGQPIFPIPEPKGTNAMAGLGQLGVQTLNALQTPEMIVTAPAAANPVGRALFAADMGRHIPEQVEQGAQVIGDIETTPAQKVVAGGTPVIAGTMTALLGKSEIPRPAIAERVIAKTEAAVPGALSKAKAALLKAESALAAIERNPDAAKGSQQIAAENVREFSDQVQQLEKPIERGIPDEQIKITETQPEITQPQAEAPAVPRESARGEGGAQPEVLLDENITTATQGNRSESRGMAGAAGTEPLETNARSATTSAAEAQGPKDVLKSGVSEAELTADIARYSEIQAEIRARMETASETDLMDLVESPLSKEKEALKNKYGGFVPVERGLQNVDRIMQMPDGQAAKLNQKAESFEGFNPKPEDVPALENALEGAKVQEAAAVEAAAAPGATPADQLRFKAAAGRAAWLQTALEGAKGDAGKNTNWAGVLEERAKATTPGATAKVPARQAPVVEPGVGVVPENVSGAEYPKLISQQTKRGPVWGVQTSPTEASWVGSKGFAERWMQQHIAAKPLPEPAGQIKAGEELPVPAASQAVSAKPALASAESKLAEVVNQTVEAASPTRLGASPAATMRPMDVVLGLGAPDLRSISPAVEARWQQAVKGTEGIIAKVKTQADEAWKSITREYADLPPREFPAEIDVLRRQRASPNASARTAVDVLKGITNNLGPKQYGVFNRVALLEDLVKDVESGKYATGKDLPFGYKEAGELTADLNKFRSVAEATPQIKAALERRQEFMDSMRGTLVERGFLPESVLSDPRYFHHQVLLYMAEKNAPAGSRSFREWFSGWQKKRTGSSLDYNRQYVEAEAEVLADAFNKFTNQDLHGEMRGIADIAPQLKEVHGAEWRQHIPKKYTTWQPKRGNIFYQVQTVAERVMDRYLSGLGDILPSEFKEALAVGGRRQEWVIPKPLAKVLDNIAPRPDNWIGNLATTMHRSWRKYILLNPLRAAKYNLNNLSGDLDFLFAAQPKIFNEFKAAAPDMWGFHVKGKSAVGDIKEAMQDGVIGSGWRASELPDIARSDYFNWLTGEKPKLVDRYWNWVGKRTDAREDTGRLASYRFAKKEWEAGRPFYGASVPADVNALATPRLKAAKVAREILIDYGRGTEFSNFMRAKIAPFFKWMEGNFVRYQQLIRNIPEHEGAGPRVAGAAGKKAATLALRMGAAYGIVNLWNHMFFPKEEEELGDARNQLHLILGRDDQGNVQTIRFQGALSDLLGWVGGEDLPQDVKDVATGKASVGDKMEDAYEAGVSRAVNASLPFPKTAAEIGLGRSFYPNALSPRPVRDKAEHAAGLFSLKPVYQWLAGKPHKPLRQEIANLISYTADPGEAAYNTTRHMAGEWLEDQGEERANVIPGKRSNALYYYKQALRYKDQATAQKFLDEYNRLGGSREGLTQSIRASAPLSMLGTKRKAFLDSLSPQEQEAVKRAEEWYRKVYER